MLNKLHAYLGLMLILPLFVWAVTGLIFLAKPGYKSAYEQLTVAQRPVADTITVEPQANWQQLRFLRSGIGHHLLVTTTQGKALHLNPRTLAPYPLPAAEDLERLFHAATEHDRQRYGEIADVEQEQDFIRMRTNTEILLELHWPTLHLRQSGEDTRFIERLYRLHYLQWTPSPTLNGAVVLLALLALLGMCFVGLRMLISFHHQEQQ